MEVFLWVWLAVLLIACGLVVRVTLRSARGPVLKILAVCGLVALLGFASWVSAMIYNIANGGH
jgi:hypothetical protein